jgi:hypothetical protein
MTSATKSYEETIDFIAAGTTPEAVVAFRPSVGCTVENLVVNH